jgi:hypothetical protein
MKSSEAPVTGKQAANEAVRRFGKDELNLADWKVGVATYQQPETDDGRKLDRFTTSIERGDGTRQVVTREAPSSVGLPTAADDDVLLALEYLTYRAGFTSDVVRFQPTELLGVLQWPSNKYYRRRLRNSLERLKKVSITYTDIWYDRESHAVAPEFFTGVLAEARLVFLRGRPQRGTMPDSFIQWVGSLFESMKRGNLATIDLDLHFSLTRPGSRQLHRHLNKRRYGARKHASYERDLKELACGHLGMEDCKDLKRNFHACVEELIRRGYLAADAARYIKIRPGVWRVRFDFCALNESSGVGESLKDQLASNNGSAAALVREYHRHRFGRENYIPKAKELQHAEMLLKGREIALLQKLVPGVAKTVEHSFGGKDCHFGAAVPSFELALDKEADKERMKAREAGKDQDETETQSALQKAHKEKQSIRTQRMATWKTLSKEEQSRLYEAAILRARNDFARQHLWRTRDLQNPASEVLALMAANLPIGE